MRAEPNGAPFRTTPIISVQWQLLAALATAGPEAGVQRVERAARSPGLNAQVAAMRRMERAMRFELTTPTLAK